MMRRKLNDSNLSILLFITVLLLVALSATNLGARDESGISLEASVDYVSKYVWRGLLINDEPVLQPSITFEHKGFSANLWGSFDLTDYGAESGDYNNRENRFQEIDYTVSYSRSFETISLEGGIIWYDNQDLGPGWNDTKELFLSLELPATLTSSVTAYYDINEAEGIYVTAGIEYYFTLTDNLLLGAGAGIGWGDNKNNLFNYGVNDDAFSDLMLSASLEYSSNEVFTLTPYVSYSEILYGNLEDAVLDPKIFVFGVNFSFLMQ